MKLVSKTNDVDEGDASKLNLRVLSMMEKDYLQGKGRYDNLNQSIANGYWVSLLDRDMKLLLSYTNLLLSYY